MARTYNVIDADGHILEPFTLWNEYLDPAFRDRAPRLIKDNTGKQRLLLEEKLLGSRAGFGGIGGVGARQGVVAAESMDYEDGRKGGFDPHARIPDMDLDGIDAAFLYPSLGLFIGSITDAAFAGRDVPRVQPLARRLLQALSRPAVRHRHAADAVDRGGASGDALRPQGARLPRRFPAAQSLQRPQAALARLRAVLARAEEIDFCIGIHEGGNSGMPTVGVDRFDGRGAQHIISHTMEMMLAAMSMIWGGVCERHPRLRVGFLESGGGWIAPWLDRMDRHFDDKGFNDSGLKIRPSELFQRNCWISFEPVEGSIGALADYIGPHKILWATDYPHRDGFFPGAPDMVRERMKGLSPDTQHQIMAGGAMGFYGLH
jgi:hypothetical protein